MGIIDRRLREKQRRMEEIVDAAKRIFSKKGFAAATMNDIADSSELSRRTLYIYFKSKEELSLAVAASALQHLERSFADISAGPGTAYERLDSMFEIYRRLAVDDPGRFQFLTTFAETIASIDQDTDAFRDCSRALEEIVREVADLLKTGRIDGSLRYEGDPDEVASTIIFVIHSIVGASFSYRTALPSLLGTTMESTIDHAMAIVKSFINKKIDE